tara:strand:- start:1777 stop:2208 length:432 start_codon:yes stop_codon:yes gene_type:complete
MAFTDQETFNLEVVGAPELQVTYKRPGMMSYEDARDYFKKHKKYSAKNEAVKYESIEEFLGDQDIEFEWVMSLITAWNLRDATSNELLSPPSEKPEVWDKVPALYLAYIIKKIKEDPTGSDFLARSLAQDLNGFEKSMITLKP